MTCEHVIAAFALFLFGCSSTPTTSDVVVAQELQAPVTAPPPPAAKFVVIHRNKKLYVEPNEDAAFLQYRDDKAQAVIQEKEREKNNKRNDKRSKRYAKEIEREKKRLKKIKDPDDRDEYVLKRRDSRARRYIKAIKKRAKRSREGHPNSRYVAAEILEDKGEWLKIRTLTGSEAKGHCYDRGLPGLKTLTVDLWVKRGDLSEVTIRREAFQIWRGSEIKLAPGVALTRSQNKFIAAVDGFRFALKVPQDARSDRYSSRGFFEAPYTDTTFTDIALAEGLLKIDARQYLPYNPYFGLYVTATLWVGKKFYVSTQTPCGEYTVHATEDLLEPVGRRGALRLKHGDEQVKPPWVASKSTIYNIRGERVGKVAKDTRLQNEIDAPSGFRCFEQPAWRKRSKRAKRQPHHYLSLCFEDDDVGDDTL